MIDDEQHLLFVAPNIQSTYFGPQMQPLKVPHSLERGYSVHGNIAIPITSMKQSESSTNDLFSI